jgi:hypothetical protein
MLLGAAPVFGAIALIVVLFGTIWVTAAVLADICALVHAAAAARRLTMGRPAARQNVDYGIGDDCWTNILPAADPYREPPRVEILARGSPIAACEFLSAHVWRRAVPSIGAVWLGTFVTLSLCRPCGSHRDADLQAAKDSVYAIHAAARAYRNEHPGTCPSIDDLRRDEWLDRGFLKRDAWGNAYEIVCGSDDVVVRTAGPDRRPGTLDDIVVPRP